MDPIKVGAAVAAVGVGATGAGFGVFNYLNTPYSLYSFLNSVDGQALKTNYENKLGGIVENQNLFVANTPKNEWWWKKRFEEFKQDTNRSTEFENLETYSIGTSDGSRAINNVCDAAYKKDISSFSSVTSNEGKSTYKQDIAKYCTVSSNESNITWQKSTSDGA
ncbi:hypothetical protein MHSWG343_06720 [Candidatus Mycoplasma haematohominis]|uniref:Uncharacterized protein n=1 Tax=Candidatus Mycoplasma haematohominis TaxID=1494318 RepID=A0A478FQN8_9MOLU|nr:hypothetical protein MHSWG343_06720 [Candidatus Mycoplasma haemohominis]